jgi:hypothetical protein
MKRLHEALTALAKETSGDPPAALRDAVMAEFQRVRRRRPVVKWIGLAAAAAVVLALLMTPRRGPKKVVLAVQPPAPKIAVPTAEAALPTPVKRGRAVKARTRAKPGPGGTPPPAADSAEVATDFFAIPFTEPLRPEERADVFRIEMPRANMAAFGLPVAGGRLDTRVTADVLIGEDGVMRAIRLVY